LGRRIGSAELLEKAQQLVNSDAAVPVTVQDREEASSELKRVGP
jgi:hypothetical protein